MADRIFYGIETLPNEGPNYLVRIGSNGDVSRVGRIQVVDGAWYPAGIEGLAFNSKGELWAAGDKPNEEGREYLFKFHFDNGVPTRFVTPSLMVLNGYDADDISGLAPWNKPGELVGLDTAATPNPQIIGFLPPKTWRWQADDPSGRRMGALAKFAGSGGTFYGIEDGNQLNELTYLGGRQVFKTVLGTLWNPFRDYRHQDVKSLAAASDGYLYGIDTSDPSGPSLLKIDPHASNNWFVVDEWTLSSDSIGKNIQAMAWTCDPCDANCDGSVDLNDVEPFLELLFGGGAPCGACAGDTNRDGVVDPADIEGFIECLLG